MSISKTTAAADANTGNQLALSLLVYAIFCGLSYLGKFFYVFFGIASLMGLLLPLAWGRRYGNWREMGFTRQNLRPALVWGLAGGGVTALIGLWVIPSRAVPDNLGLQLAIGVPMWIVMASPFQEFFFRGWLQPRLSQTWGRWGGLLAANTLFTLWHYAAPFLDDTAVPLRSFSGFLSTFAAGLVYGWLFQRTKNIGAPWLAHVVAGIAFIIAGVMDFTQPAF